MDLKEKLKKYFSDGSRRKIKNSIFLTDIKEKLNFSDGSRRKSIFMMDLEEIKKVFF